MLGTAASSECRDVGLECALGERQVTVKCDNSDPAVQTLSERLSPERPLCPRKRTLSWYDGERPLVTQSGRDNVVQPQHAGRCAIESFTQRSYTDYR